MGERYIAGIEISSSKIIAAVGKTRGDGGLDILAIEQEAIDDAIRYGIIQNLEETSVTVARLFSRIEQRAAISPRKIKSVVVGLAGRSLRNVPTEVSLSLPEDSEITDEILERLRDKALHTILDNSLEVVDAVPRIYKVGNSETLSPKGAIGNSITATYDLIVCRPELKRNIRRTITDKLHHEVEGFVVTAMATGHLILTGDEKRLGCMLVDIGAETTAVTLYKNGTLRYFATLPLGGRNITRDITCLGVLEARAEEIKKTVGNAISDPDASTLNINGLKNSDVCNLVVARSEEIVANIIEQIEYAGLKSSDLTGGIICIGGGSRLKGMEELLHQQSDLPVRRGKLPDYVKITDQRGQNTENIEVASVLYAGATLSEMDCLTMPEKDALPITGELPFDEEEKTEEKREAKPHKRNKFIESINRRLGTLFRDPEDDSELLD